MRDLPWTWMAPLLALGLPIACADPCLDDGLGQDERAACLAGEDASATGSGGLDTDGSMTDTMVSATMSATMGTDSEGMSGSQTGTETESETLDSTASDDDASGDETVGVSVTDGDSGSGDVSATDGDGSSDGDASASSDGASSGAGSSGMGSASDTAGPTLWCVDADDDGFGDPDDCEESDDPIPGSVDNDEDCDDTDEDTFPGAAPNDDEDACMQDADGDDWGDDDAPPGVQDGTDCDDEDANAFPGAAPNEDPPDLCTVDADDDDWGDANPGGGGGGGPQPGSDCYDDNADVNPDTLQLTVFVPFNAGAAVPRRIDVVDEGDAGSTPFITLLTPGGGIPNVNIGAVAFDGDADILANDLVAARIYDIDYAATCEDDEGTATTVGMPYGTGGIDIVCGLEFTAGGDLLAIEQSGDDLLTFNPATGQITDSVPLTLAGGGALNIASCGMARDCTEERLIVANGIDQNLYAIDPETGEAEVLRDLTPYLGAGAWTPVGLEYDPVSRTVLLSTGPAMYRVELDDDVAPVLVGNFDETVSNLQYLPECAP